jgi:hypothetical protein
MFSFSKKRFQILLYSIRVFESDDFLADCDHCLQATRGLLRFSLRAFFQRIGLGVSAPFTIGQNQIIADE